MSTLSSRAFLDEIRTQQQAALLERAEAARAGDELGVASATGRLRDLEELARRNDAWPGLEQVTA